MDRKYIVMSTGRVGWDIFRLEENNRHHGRCMKFIGTIYPLRSDLSNNYNSYIIPDNIKIYTSEQLHKYLWTDDI